jgi:hypothetical protein
MTSIAQTNLHHATVSSATHAAHQIFFDSLAPSTYVQPFLTSNRSYADFLLPQRAHTLPLSQLAAHGHSPLLRLDENLPSKYHTCVEAGDIRHSKAAARVSAAKRIRIDSREIRVKTTFSHLLVGLVLELGLVCFYCL